MEKFTELNVNDLRLNKKQFNRFLSIGLIFALFGYFYIVSPYFKYKTEEKKTKSEYAASKESIRKYTQEARKYHELSKKLKSELNRIENKIHQFPDELARSLALISSGGNNASAFQQVQQTANMSIEPEIPDNILSDEEKVKFYIDNWFEEFIHDIRENIIAPASEAKLDTEIKSKTNIDTLAANAIRTINKHIQEIDPDFWHSYHGGKVPVARRLEDVVEEVLIPVFQEIDAIVNISKNIELDLRNKIEKDSIVITQFKVSITKLEERINSIESPIGKVPLNLVDFVQLFPILIIVLIVMLTNYCIKCIKLRADLRAEFTKMNIEKNKGFTQNITDCWFLPPYRNVFRLFMLFLSGLVIIGIYIISILHVIDYPEMFVSFTGEEEALRKNLFYIAYWIGILIIVVCFWIIQKQLKSTALAENN